MAYQRKRRKMTAEINVVPYIDVMLVLLIIFMVTAPFVTQGVDVQLPQTSSAKTAADLAAENDEANFIIVEVNQEGGYRLSVDNGPKQSVSAEDLLVRVKAELQIKPKSTVMVGGDARVPYADVILALDLLNQAGVDSVGLMTQPLEN
ncbi:protein TolR [Vibrio sp. SS-MA-C1-2]|uniref:protein TolR n=1 Tax=Vibrio sp. SS-MA-C1-2 TaxID=2908646 RepID=UPI001F443639|nr:protein TolR [Vibrio sp. SS-MA-C1-2]UJF18622.1 protein TolR [Vibrio sp. SS-MA-C1-2]